MRATDKRLAAYQESGDPTSQSVLFTAVLFTAVLSTACFALRRFYSG